MRWKVGLIDKYSEKLAYFKFSDRLYYVDWRIATDSSKIEVRSSSRSCNPRKSIHSQVSLSECMTKYTRTAKSFAYVAKLERTIKWILFWDLRLSWTWLGAALSPRMCCHTETYQCFWGIPMITLHYLMCLDDVLLWYAIGYLLTCKTDLTMTLSGGRGTLRYRYSFFQNSV